MIKEKAEINEVMKHVSQKFAKILFDIALKKYLILYLIEVLKQKRNNGST